MPRFQTSTKIPHFSLFLKVEFGFQILGFQKLLNEIKKQEIRDSLGLLEE